MATATLTKEQVEATVRALTTAGRETMLAIGQHKTSFFDDGIVEHSGIWGECLVSEMGHKSSGVINRLRDLGLFTVTEQDPGDASMWWALTSLGAAVANNLAETAVEQSAKQPQKQYAVVLADGKSEDGFRTKALAILRGEALRQDFTVLSPRGHEVHFGKAPKPEPEKRAKYVAPEWKFTGPGRKSQDLAVGDECVSSAARNLGQPFTVARVHVGRKIVKAWDGNGTLQLWCPVDARV